MTTNTNPGHLPADIDPLLPLDELAVLAGNVHRATLRRCFKRGELQFVRISPRRVGVRKSEAIRWLQSMQPA